MKIKLMNVLKNIGLFLVFLFFPIFFFELIGISPSNLKNSELIFYELISNILVLIIFVAIHFKDLKKDFKLFLGNFTNNLKIAFKYWIIGFSIMILSNILIIFILNKGIAGNEQEVRRLINIYPIFMIFNTIVYAPLIEELLFRKGIRECISNKYIYIFISGLIFGLLHIINFINSPSDILYLIPYGSLGIVFASLYYKTNNIFNTICMHSFHNALALLFMFLGDLL